MSCLLIGVFSPFIFNVISDIVGLSLLVILLIVFYLSYWFFALLFLPFLSSFGLTDLKFKKFYLLHWLFSYNAL